MKLSIVRKEEGRRTTASVLAALIAALAIQIVGGTVACAQDEISDAESKRTEKEALIRSVREALRRRLSDAAMPQFVKQAPPDEALATGEPQSGRNPRPAPGQTSTQRPLQPLTLDEVIHFVNLYHPKIRGADVERRIAAAKRLEKQGAFDPVLFAGSETLRFNTELDNVSRRGKSATMQLADAGFEYQTRYGVKIGAGARFNLGKVKSPLSPTGNGGEYFLELKVPMMRGARINEKWAAERQAFLGEPLADATFQLSRLEVVLKAAETYWDWIGAKRKLDVARQLLDLALFRLGAVRDRVTAGDLPRIDAVEAELEVQRRREGVVKAERELQKAAFKLSLFLWSPNGLPAPIPEEGNVPATTAPPVVFTDDQAVAGQRFALERRPELQFVTLNRDITQIDLDLARNQRLPAIDLSLSPGRDTGFGGIGNTFKAGLNFTLPLRQRTADGRIGAANLKLEKLALDLANERQRISTEVLDAISAINTAHDRYRAAEQEVELARQLEEGERAKFALGDSTLFLVNQRERATAEAKIKLIQIQAEYEQAVATFRAVTVQY
jgi:outer membrane protein TolC